MTKIFKQLARHWAVCLVVFALLFVQAYCDLSLPDYTSKIVDTGIQQGGIESPLPATVRQSTLDALSLLMREEDAAASRRLHRRRRCAAPAHRPDRRRAHCAGRCCDHAGHRAVSGGRPGSQHPPPGRPAWA